MDPTLLAAGLLIGFVLVHLLEEILTGFRHKFPLGEMPVPVFLGINLLLYGYAGVMIKLLSVENPGGELMAWIFASGMLLNGLGHLGYMIWLRRYFPGGVTAVLVVGFSLNLMMILTRFS